MNIFWHVLYINNIFFGFLCFLFFNVNTIVEPEGAQASDSIQILQNQDLEESSLPPPCQLSNPRSFRETSCHQGAASQPASHKPLQL